MRVYAFNRNDPDCVSAVEKLATTKLRPGMFVPLTEEEFIALRDGLMWVDVETTESKAP